MVHIISRKVRVCVAAALALAATAALAQDAGGHPQDLAVYANPLVGTDAAQPDFGTGGGAGNTFPGPTLPFGMVQFSPETDPSRVNYTGGYTYSDSTIRGFSLTHFSGAGCGIFQDLPLVPTTEQVTESPARPGSANLKDQFLARFDHAHEEATPGYYRVRLNPTTTSPVDVELTTATRTGIARLTFPGTPQASVLLNAGGSAMANDSVRVSIDPARREVSGEATSGRFCYQANKYTVYFSAEFSHPFSAYGTWESGQLYPGSTDAQATAVIPYPAPFEMAPPGTPTSPYPRPSGTAQGGAYVTFDTTRERVVEARVGISFVSVENARENLWADTRGRSFDAVRRAARAEWNDTLGRIEVTGGSRADLRVFYTALYHSLLGANVFSDANGEYFGFDGKVHRAAGFTKYATYSGWDTYRTQIPLVAILFPDRASDMVQSLVVDAKESGWLPKWSQAATHTNVMVGDPADPIIASAYALGARRFDTAAALDAMVKGATRYERAETDRWRYVERPGNVEYQTLGYVPHEEDVLGATPIAAVTPFVDPGLVWGSAATTLEYTVADCAIAQFASALSKEDVAATFLKRADN